MFWPFHPCGLGWPGWPPESHRQAILVQQFETALVTNIIAGPCSRNFYETHAADLPLEVLQQFRVIYGTMRQYFRTIEQCCGLPGSQMWILQEVERTPSIGVTELAQRLGIHQSTCSQLVEKLVGQHYLENRRTRPTCAASAWCSGRKGGRPWQRLPARPKAYCPAHCPASRKWPKTLNINLAELIFHLRGRDDEFAQVPLAEMVRDAE